MRKFAICIFYSLCFFCFIREAAYANTFTLTGNVIGPTCSVDGDTRYDFGVLSATAVHQGGSLQKKIFDAPINLILKCTGSRGGATQNPTLEIKGAQDSTQGNWPSDALTHCFSDSKSTVHNACIFLSKTDSSSGMLTVTPDGDSEVHTQVGVDLKADGMPYPIRLWPGIMGWSDGNSQSGVLSSTISVSLDWK